MSGHSNFHGPLHRRGIHDLVDESDSDLDFEIPKIFTAKKVRTDISGSATAFNSLGDLTRRQDLIRNITSPWNRQSLGLFHQSHLSPIPSLLDLTAREVGKTCTCEVLEHCSPPLDEALLRKVAFWAFPTDEAKVKAYVRLSDLFRIWSRGKNMVEDDRVREMWQVGFMATAYIVKYSKDEDSAVNDVRVSLAFERQHILSSTCSECKSDIWCAHVVAAVIYRMHYPDRVRVHAPMTETLSTLSRDQLQKILQYAVYEDPAGILGKVFKHIDAVRDHTSDVNTEAGIPDPTFGRMEFANSDWQMSLDVFQERLTKNLAALTDSQLCDDMDRYYPASYDKVKKQKSYLSWFNQCVTELIRSEEYRGAARVLVLIMNNVVKEMNNSIIHDSLKYYFHDLCRFYAIVMVYIQDKDPKAWKLLCNSTEELNRIPFPDIYKLKTSHWAELPSLASCFPKLEEDLLFYEPVAACKLQPATSVFNKMFEHQPTSVDCCPHDDICILFARLEGYVKFGMNIVDKHQNIVNLLLHILLHLYRYAKKFSIIGEYIAQAISEMHQEKGSDISPGSDIIQNWHDTTKKAPDSLTLPHTTLKVRGKRRSITAGNSPPELKKIKTAHGKGKKGSGRSKGKVSARKSSDHRMILTKGQLAYGITYCCYIIINVERKANIHHCPTELLLSYVMLALELGSFRTSASAKQVSKTEHQWLQYLEKNLSSYLQDNLSVTAKVVQNYMDAFLKIGHGFNDGVYPLVLLDAMCYKISSSPALRYKWCCDVIHVLAALLKTLPDHLDRYMLSSDNKASYYCTDDTGKNCKRVIQDKICSLTTIFLSLIQQGNNYHESIVIEVLCQFRKLDSITTLIDIEDVVIKLCGLKCGKKLLQALVEFTLYAYKTGCPGPVSLLSTLRELLYSLCRKLGVSSLNLIPKNWPDTFSLRDVHDLIFLFEADIRQFDKPPKKVTDLILEVLGNCFPCTEQICDLLSFFQVGDTNHKKAVQMILKNRSAYHPDVLITVSREIFEKKKSEACEDHESDCMKLIEAALEQVKHFGSLSDTQVDLLCSVATGVSSRDISNNIPYKIIVSQFAKSCNQHPDMLVHMLQNMEKAGNSWLKHATPVTDTLIPAYATHFCTKLCNCSNSSYNNLVRKMLIARFHCMVYVENGASRFYEEVVLKVRQYHQNKKKLISMLDRDFPTPD